MGDDAWTQLHGPNERPKSYIPPFLRDNSKKPLDFATKEQQRLDDLYSIEIEAGLEQPKPRAPNQNNMQVTFS